MTAPTETKLRRPEWMSTGFWMIERSRDYQAQAPEYLSFTGMNVEDDPRYCSGSFAWYTSPYDAIQFVRKRDAIRLLTALIGLMRVQPFYNIPDGLRPNDPVPVITYHAPEK